MNTINYIMYKSSRRNAKSSDIKYISAYADSEEKIIDQIIEATAQTVTYSGKHNDHIEIMFNVFIEKTGTYKNVYNQYYEKAETLSYHFGRKQFYSIESAIRSIYKMFCLIYPDNTLTRQRLFENPSIKYYINNYYHTKKKDL